MSQELQQLETATAVCEKVSGGTSAAAASELGRDCSREAVVEVQVVEVKVVVPWLLPFP